MFKPVNPKVSFPELEKEILDFWESEKIFEKSLAKNSPKGDYVFYEGPPTANGKPGLHHVLARAFKDVMPRYKTMQGYRVPRKAGWDTHGLPVEIEIEKKLGINGKQDIEKIKATPEESIIEFNKLCKESVWAYKKDWEDLTRRMGFWVDMNHPYITYENNYIKSVWWVVSQAFKKGLLYKGHKIVPYCPRCGTALSSHELAQGYKEVEEKSIYIKFKVKPGQAIGDWTTDDNTFFLVWTTTPWTLPGNVALAVDSSIKYQILNIKGENFILAKSRLESVLNEGSTFVATKVEPSFETDGSQLLNLEYKPLYSFIPLEKKAHFVISGDFVSDSDGTGIVHIAPAFGEDDYSVGKANDLPVLMTLDKEGKMLPEITPWAGKGTKESDPEIIADLESRGLLYKVELYKHDYPFCWRCDTALLYYARDSWFIEMTKLKKELVTNNENITWVPENIKHGRFGEWLENVKDWAISRDRYWGSPLPIWICEKCGKQKCVSSIEELKTSKDFAITYPTAESLDLHKPYIDKITFDCECSGIMVRAPEVMDVWLDSGSMPYAQWGYKGEKGTPFDNSFPANYISEAIDQTRGWFYTLHAISTFLGLGNCFKNVICLGHIMDSKGKKMSKSKGNILEPMKIADEHGFDAIRWFMYTTNQPGETKLVGEESIRDQVRRFLLILWNTYSFFVTYANIRNFEPKCPISGLVPTSMSEPKKDAGKGSNMEVGANNVFDQWLISRKNQTIKRVTESLEKYDIFTATRTIEEFVIELSTWYLRRNKKRDNAEFLQVLHETLADIVKMLAPFAPFVSDEIYKNLTGEQSVHLAQWPAFDEKLINAKLELEMEKVRKIIEMGHAIRKENHIKVRQPLGELQILDVTLGESLTDALLDIICDELNVKKVIAIPEGNQLPEGWLKKRGGIMEYLASDNPSSVLEIALNPEITPELKAEGMMREIVRLIQDARKEAKYSFSDAVKCYYQTDSQELKDVLVKYESEIKKQTILSDLTEGETQTKDIEKEGEIDGSKIIISLVK